MQVLFVPVFRVGISYTVTVGRRWSLLDRMLLVELATKRSSVGDLAIAADLPDRIVVEALINLLRSNLIEVRTGSEGALFAATAVGKRRAVDGDLRPELRREIRWVSLCMDRLTGSWMRSEDLDLVPERDLPEGAVTEEPLLSTLNYDDPDVRELVYFRPDEDLEGFEPAARAAFRTFARISVSHGDVASGLPAYASMRLRNAVRVAADEHMTDVHSPEVANTVTFVDPNLPRDTILADDLIVGGLQHLEVLRECLIAAKTHVVIHSCFVSSDTVKKLLPDFEKAARRKVRIDCLWGLRDDPESPGKLRPINETVQLLDALPTGVRGLIQLSRVSSNSHSKVVVYDDSKTGDWVSIVGSCNFLSSDFDSVEVSVRIRSQRLASQLMAHLISAQLPASGAWSPVARRLNAIWNIIRKRIEGTVEAGVHALTLLSDGDHYNMVTIARDRTTADIVVGCDLFGAAAETSVLVTLEQAARDGVRSRVFYHRPSHYLEEEDRVPDPSKLSVRGLDLVQIPDLHGKFLAWDDEVVVVTSFNWLATISRNTRARGAELGIAISGPGTRSVLAGKLHEVSGGRIDLDTGSAKVAPERKASK
jgi:hypothetical protein